ncbi:MAG: 3-methyladenine DNA glycosylase AlkD [Verrucomicrobiales bacterium]|jgi:3-methyladenine DNA glycosylase AlkD
MNRHQKMGSQSEIDSCKQIMAELKELGKESHRKTFVRHGAPEENLYGVSIADLKIIQKRLKKNHPLALELFATGNSDAMYLAALIADETLMTRTNLNRWAKLATWGMISTSVAWVAGESRHALPLAKKWIEARQEKIASTGWQTVSSYLSVIDNSTIDEHWLCLLLDRVVNEIPDERNDVKSSMNGFVIAAGCFVPELKDRSLRAAEAIGSVTVDQGNTACKVPDATAAIRKVEKAGRIGKKRRTARC